MRVSKRFPTAVHALLLIACLSPKQRVTSAVIAESTGSNAVMIRNIFLKLSENGLLITSPGKNGGVHLGRKPDEINLWDIYNAVETDDVDKIFKIYEGNGLCPVGKNVYRILLPHAESAVAAMKADMEKVTIASMMKELETVMQMSDNDE